MATGTLLVGDATCGELLSHDGRAEYQRVVGQLLYLTQQMRLDIVYAVGMLCKFTAEPRQSHLTAKRHVLGYLCGTADLELRYCGGTNFAIYADALYADCPGRKSRIGQVVLVGGTAASWRAMLTFTVASSTAEAEGMAQSEGTCAALSARKLAVDLRIA